MKFSTALCVLIRRVGVCDIELNNTFEPLLWTAFERIRLQIEGFLNSKGKNIHIFALKYDKGTALPLVEKEQI